MDFESLVVEREVRYSIRWREKESARPFYLFFFLSQFRCLVSFDEWKERSW